MKKNLILIAFGFLFSNLSFSQLYKGNDETFKYLFKIEKDSVFISSTDGMNYYEYCGILNKINDTLHTILVSNSISYYCCKPEYENSTTIYIGEIITEKLKNVTLKLKNKKQNTVKVSLNQKYITLPSDKNYEYIDVGFKSKITNETINFGLSTNADFIFSSVLPDQKLQLVIKNNYLFYYVNNYMIKLIPAAK